MKKIVIVLLSFMAIQTYGAVGPSTSSIDVNLNLKGLTSGLDLGNSTDNLTSGLDFKGLDSGIGNLGGGLDPNLMTSLNNLTSSLNLNLGDLVKIPNIENIANIPNIGDVLKGLDLKSITNLGNLDNLPGLKLPDLASALGNFKIPNLKTNFISHLSILNTEFNLPGNILNAQLSNIAAATQAGLPTNAIGNFLASIPTPAKFSLPKLPELATLDLPNISNIALPKISIPTLPTLPTIPVLPSLPALPTLPTITIPKIGLIGANLPLNIIDDIKIPGPDVVGALTTIEVKLPTPPKPKVPGKLKFSCLYFDWSDKKDITTFKGISTKENLHFDQTTSIKPPKPDASAETINKFKKDQCNKFSSSGDNQAMTVAMTKADYCSAIKNTKQNINGKQIPMTQVIINGQMTINTGIGQINTALQTTIPTAQQNLLKAIGTINDAKNKINTADSTIATAQQQINTANTGLTTIKATLAADEKTISAEQSQIQTELPKLQDELTNATTTLNELPANINNIGGVKQVLTMLQGLLCKQGDKIDPCANSLLDQIGTYTSDTDPKFVTLKSDVNNYLTLVRIFTGQLTETQQQSIVDALTPINKALPSLLINVNVKPGNLQKTLAGLGTFIASLQTELTTIPAAITKIKAAIDLLQAAETKIETILNTTIPNANTKLNNAQNQITKAQGDITTAQGKILTAKYKINDAIDKMVTAENKINSTLQSTIPTAIIKIKTAQQQVSSAQKLINAICDSQSPVTPRPIPTIPAITLPQIPLKYTGLPPQPATIAPTA
ncbi:hypothetical protein A3F06_00435 [candidate division TM6 bacterium RIFCSPHIGHO2_12_FULL_36_22]|nr:MAG: hypothetical protein A3F06_00435 [candidate division TM6 bacterium RIFCSPHIGHO2_12_FULL_36_22]